ncbi:hypothetical protein JTB14_008756 [Gonioctena quinquepunctata]|nr:hypothetical protein JTB14_008756 [Gonioctena quinquepunctata]
MTTRIDADENFLFNLCFSDHLIEEDFITKPGGKRYLKFGALPIIHRKPPVRTPPKITFDLPQFGAILPEESVEPARKSKLYYILHTEF